MAVGSLRWGTWILPGTEALSRFAGRWPGESSGINGDARPVAVRWRNVGAIPEIKAAAHDASESIEKCLDDVAKHRFDVATIEGLIDRIDDPKAWEHVASWDEAAQRVPGAGAALPVVAGSAARIRTPKQEALRKRLAELLERLKFPEGLRQPARLRAGAAPVSQER